MEHPDALPKILAFLDTIGIPVEACTLDEDGFLPAMALRGGTLLYDPAKLQWPGDLLHEAGHLAILDSAVRETTAEIEHGLGDEIAVQAWTYAAALAAGIDPRVVFHDHGYRGQGAWLAETFASGATVGQPMLQYYGLARFKHEEGEQYPAMIKWLR